MIEGNSMKQYLLLRLKKRWHIIPASIIFGVFAVLRSLAIHDGKVLGIVLLLICFCVLGILFPFRWGGEDWDSENPSNGLTRKDS